MAQFKKNESNSFDELVAHLSQIIQKETGNILGEKQMEMVKNRLSKRLSELGNLDSDGYISYFNLNREKETKVLVSILTTHHTFFFREFIHFEFLLSNLKSIVKNVKDRGDRKIKIYSAACSRGHEAYSLACFFEYHLKQFPGIEYQVDASDIDIESVDYAKNGVYPFSEVKTIPQNYLSGNWQKGTGEISRFARVKNHIRSRCKFFQRNLLESNYSERYDIVFCRNVFIYFDNNTIINCVNTLRKNLFENGYLITGLSENLKTIQLECNVLAPSVYSFSKKQELSVVEDHFSPIKVLCVDDSPSVLKLLNKILSSDKTFKIVGSATDGIEAEKFLATNKVDLMTLDIHMPNMDGVEYLKKNFNRQHPPVVMISSASREDSTYALEAAKYGASDFIEKPALNNLQHVSEEIKSKLKMAFMMKDHEPDKNLISQFKNNFEIKSAENKARVWVAPFSYKKILMKLYESLKGNAPPLFIVMSNSSNFSEVMRVELSKMLNVKIELFTECNKYLANSIYLINYQDDFKFLVNELKSKELVSLSIMGEAPKEIELKLGKLSSAQLLLEEGITYSNELKNMATDVFPATSFAHLSTEYLACGVKR